jgi:hypothetical protein
LGQVPFRILVSDDRFEASHGEAESPDATIRSDPDTLTGIVFRGKPLGQAVEAGKVGIDGSRQAVRALLRALA